MLHQRLNSLAIITSIVAVLTALPTSVSPSASSAQPFTHQIELSGPFPTRQRVALWVPTVKIGEAGDVGASLGEPVFRVRLDAAPCEAVFQPFIDAVIVSTATAQLDLGDCDYAHRVRRGPYHVTNGETVEINVELPEPSLHEHDPWLSVSRYRGDLVRIRMGGTELDELIDDPMGGAVAVFSYRRNFGSDVDPWSAGRGEHAFNTCPPGGLWACYSSTMFVYTEPEPAEPQRNLVVSEVWGPPGPCPRQEEFSVGVTLHNPEHAASAPFRVQVSLLDPDTHASQSDWISALQPGLSAGATSPSPIVVTMDPPAGEHDFMVSATTDRGEMHSAAEFSLRCLRRDPIPRLVDEPPAPTPNISEPQRDVILPTRTATPEPADTDRTIRRPTATPTATPDVRRDLDPLVPR